MRETPLSIAEREFVLKCLSERSRLDGREPFEFRPITISFGKDIGCCIVDIGDTKVMAQVAAEIDRPRESRPSEGRMNIHVEMSQMASPNFNPGKPGDLGVELQRMLERSIVMSQSVDLEELCVRVGERVWKVSVHIHILSHDGNILDCSSIAAITALAHFRRPDITISGKDVHVHTLDEKQPLPLVINHYPFCASFGLFDNGELLVLDPTELEERVMDGRMMVSCNKHREICCMQMSGQILVNKEQMLRCTNIAFARIIDLTDLVKKALKHDQSEREHGKKESNTTNKTTRMKQATKSSGEDLLEHKMESNEELNKENMSKLINKSSDKVFGDGTKNSWFVDSSCEEGGEKVRNDNDVTMDDSGGEEEAIVMQQSDVGVFVLK